MVVCDDGFSAGRRKEPAGRGCSPFSTVPRFGNTARQDHASTRSGLAVCFGPAAPLLCESACVPLEPFDPLRPFFATFFSGNTQVTSVPFFWFGLISNVAPTVFAR